MEAQLRGFFRVQAELDRLARLARAREAQDGPGKGVTIPDCADAEHWLPVIEGLARSVDEVEAWDIVKLARAHLWAALRKEANRQATSPQT